MAMEGTQKEPKDLIGAATWGDVNFLENCLQNGAEPNEKDEQGNTPLHVACYYGELECASVLLSYKANVNAIGAQGKTPLHKAVSGVLALVPGPKFHSMDRIKDNQTDLVKLLVTRGGDMKICDKDGNTPRALAMQYEFYECVDVLDELTRINEEEEKKRLFRESVAAQYAACYDGDTETLSKLLPSGPDTINHCLKDGITLLMLAAWRGHAAVVNLLLDFKPTIIFDKSLRTALHYAAEGGNVDIVRALLQKMPRLLEFDESQEGTSLHLAARHGRVDVVKFFLGIASVSESERPPCKPRNEELPDSTSLDKPVDERSVEQYVNVISRSPKDCKTPLHEAAINGHVEIVRAFVDHLQQYPPQKRRFHTPTTASSPAPSPGLSPNPSPAPTTPRGPPRTPTLGHNTTGIDLMTTRGLTPLHEAARRGYTQIIEILLDAGADINAIMRPGIDITVNAELTALVEAGMSNKIDMVRFLLQKGATDARLKALHRVIRPAYNDIAGVLLSHNGAVTVDNGLMEIKKRKGNEDVNSTLLLSVSWAGKKLPYIHPSWLAATIIEAPRPKADLYAISQLNVSENTLHELPIEVFQLRHLHHLDASRNEISTIPVLETKDEGGWECQCMEFVDLSKNQLTSLPSVLLKLPHLRELNVCHNKIQEVPMEIWLAPSLKKLYLQNNLLTSIPSPLSRRDSGISTWEPSGDERTDGGQALSSFSPPAEFASLPLNLSTPPSRYAVTSLTRHHNPNLLLRRRRLETSPIREDLCESVSQKRRVSFPIISNHSRLLDMFSDNQLEPNVFDEGEDFSSFFSSEKVEQFSLEVLDLSNNKLTEIPTGLSCLAPQLQKMLLHHNQLVSLGSISDYPAEIELLDVGYNQLTTAIAFNLQRDDLRSLPCAQKMLLSHSRSSFASVTCSHRTHSLLKKLSYLRLNNNQLKDMQLFQERWWKRRDLGLSIDETNLRRRTQSYGDRHRVDSARQGFNKSAVEVSPSSHKRSAKESVSEDSSDEGSSSSSGTSKRGSQDLQCQVICAFPTLSSLDVSYNQLLSVPAHIHRVTSLSVLVISYNSSIDTLPLELSTLDNLWSLEYKGVPLVNPAYQDLDKFHSVTDKLQYMRSLLHNAKPFESMKLMLVGLQAQGKTSLLARLREVNETRFVPSTFTSRVKGDHQKIGDSYRSRKAEPPLSTVGVDLGVWKYRKDLEPGFRKRGGKMKSVTFYTWDFGGQEEYYVTHQCFLSSRALYLVIFDVTDGENGVKELGPWLLNIQARAPGSPVVIVGTHLDRIKGEVEKERLKQEMIGMIREKFPFEGNAHHLKELGLPNIKDVCFVGCPVNGKLEGVAELRQGLYDIAFSLTIPQRRGMGSAKAKLLEQNIPASYLLLERRVRELAVRCQQEDSSPVIRDAQFRELTKDIISNSRELNQAATFLHENGVMLHYDTPALSHLFFVDPQWLCDMLAHVVTVPEVNSFIVRGKGKEPGILRTNVLSHVFRGRLFPQQYKKEYVELLEKFEVAIQLDRVRLLVPSMLATQPSWTIHRFKNVFPRPPLSLVLQQAAQQQDESPTKRENVSVSRPSSGETCLYLENPAPDLAHPIPPSPPLHRTGLLLRRFYFMTYVPSGFWARLISRFLTCTDISRTVLTSIGFPAEDIEQVISQLISGAMVTWVNLEWSYWKTGIELWYKGCSLLRVAEILPGSSFQQPCSACPEGFNFSSSSSSSPIEPSIDSDDLSFQLGDQWMPVELTPNSGIEILIPDYICTAPRQSRNSQRSSTSTILDDPTPSTQDGSWMSAQLLAIVVHLIDSLLEEWYVGISTREGLRIGLDLVIPYINRIVPCPACVSGAEPLPPDLFKVWSDIPPDDLLDTEEEHFSNSVPIERGKGARRDLLPHLNMSTAQPPPVEEDTELLQATKFGFMLDRCLAALSGLEPLVCPAHPNLNLSVGDIAPDLVFADLPPHFIIAENCLHQGKFVAEGAFGKIYQGILYPHSSATDDEGREVAIKVGKQEKHSSGPESLMKSYAEVRVEVTVLKRLCHEHVIEFLGVRLQPLGFLIEWAPLGGFHTILKSYFKSDARISPWVLCETARQVASGVAYLHQNNVVYYDLKSPNVLVFMFPSPSDSIACSLGHTRVSPSEVPVLVKVSDMGISQMLSPGGVMGFKGTHGFMAPEILLYKGHEAYTEKVDVFSFSMFMYELISLQCPFERQNFMSTQIDKMVSEGERPPLQYRELNNPILYLDIMRWAWQQDFHHRPSAAQLEKILASPSIPLMVDAFNLQPYCDSGITASCTVTLPIDISTSSEGLQGGPPMSPPAKHSYVTQGDIQEEVWLCSFVDPEVTGVPEALLSIISFRGRANFCVDPVKVGNSAITSICCVNNGVNNSVWLGSENGLLMIFDAITHALLYSRTVAISARHGVISISHITNIHQVLLVRSDGSLLLFDETVNEHKMTDVKGFDGRVYEDTFLPVKSVLKTPERNAALLCAQLVCIQGSDCASVWCGSQNEIIYAIDVSLSLVHHCRRLKHRDLSQTSAADKVVHMAVMERDKNVYLWTHTHPHGMLYLWNCKTEKLVTSLACKEYTSQTISSLLCMGNQFFLGTSEGTIHVLNIDTANAVSTVYTLSAHTRSVHTLLALGSRILPRQWLPTLIGRSNVIKHPTYAGCISQEDIDAISERMIGHQQRLLVSIGHGFHGVCGKLVEPLMNQQDLYDTYVLLWLPPR